MATEATSKVVIVFARELKAAAAALKDWLALCENGTQEQKNAAGKVMLDSVAAALHGVADANIDAIVLSHADPIQLTVKTKKERGE